MTPRETAEVLATAFLPWPHVQIEPATVKLWFELFQGETVQDFWAAMRAAIKVSTGSFPPTPGQVNNQLVEVKAAQAGEQITEGQAWSMLVDTVRRFGSYRQLEGIEHLRKLDARVAEAAICLGWREICGWHVDDAPANRAHFWRVYGDLKAVQKNKALRGDVQALPVQANIRKLLNTVKAVA